MKHWYQQPHKLIADYVRTVLILEGFSESDTADLPIFTNGMSAFFCKTEKDKNGNENIIQLALFGKSVPEEDWIVKQMKLLSLISLSLLHWQACSI